MPDIRLTSGKMETKKSEGTRNKTNSVSSPVSPSGTDQIPAGDNALFSKGNQTTKTKPSDSASAAEVQETVLDPVNMATGEFLYEDNDFVLPDYGGDYRFTRRYVSGKTGSYRGSLGTRWTFGAETAVTRDGTVTTVTLPDGKTVEFTYEDGNYRNRRGGTEAYTLLRPEEEFLFTDHRKELRYRYAGDGTILQITDRNGNSTDYRYCDQGIEEIRLASGYTLTFVWKDRKVASVTDSTGRSVYYGYDRSLLTTVIRCDGTRITYTYDGQDNLAAITDALGCTYLYNRYDWEGRVIRQELAGGGCYDFSYDDAARTVTFRCPETGAETRYIHDGRMDITCVCYPDGTTEEMETDRWGNICRKKDRCGAVTTYTHDIRGHLLARREPSGLVLQQEYDGDHLVRQWDNTGRSVRYRHDARGNITETRILLDAATGQEAVTTCRYDDRGRLLRTSENDTAVTEYRYTGSFPKPAEILEPDGTRTCLVYDPAGRLAERTAGDITERYTYTEYNKIRTYTDGEGGTTAYYYDEAWRLVKTVRPEQNRTGTAEDAGEQYAYDGMDRLTAVTDACGRRTGYQRNSDGAVVQERRFGGNRETEESIRYDYDRCGNRLRKHTGTYGCERYFYDACGRLVKKVPAGGYDDAADDGPGYTYGRDRAGRITEVRDPYGTLTDHYTYDLHGNVTCHRHHFDRLRVEAGQTGRPAAEDGTDGAGSPGSVFSVERWPGDCYTYDTAGRMTRKLELLDVREGIPRYAVTTYSYDASGHLLRDCTYKEPQTGTGNFRGAVRIVDRRYDAGGKLVRAGDNTGACVRYEYDSHGRMIRETRKTGETGESITEYDYDRCGRVVAERRCGIPAEDPVAGAAGLPSAGMERRGRNRFLSLPKQKEAQEPVRTEPAETRITYDRSGHRVRLLEPEGLLCTWEYDASGKETACILTGNGRKGREEAGTRERRFTYDAYGYPASREENGRKTVYKNDAFGNRLAETFPDGGTAGYRYDSEGHCICSIPPEAYAAAGEAAAGTVYRYDLCGRERAVYRPDGTLLRETAYDSAGQVIRERDGDGCLVRYTYDAGGRCTAAESAGGVRQEASYDALGSRTASALGDAVTTYETDRWGRVTAVHAPEGVLETCVRDHTGQVISVVDGEGKRRDYHRTPEGLADRITHADGKWETIRYNRSGRAVTVTARSGTRREYTYDVFGNLLEERTIRAGEAVAAVENGAAFMKGSGESRDIRRYRYAPDGRLLEAGGGGIRYRYFYDACGRLESKSACGRTLLRYTYDLNGDLRTLTDATGKTTEYGYDGCRRLVSIREDGKSLAEYRYTPGGRRSRVICGDIVTEYEYDSDGNTAGIRVCLAGSLLYELRYTYDCRGECIRKELAGGHSDTGDFMDTATEYTYDGLGRLTGETRRGTGTVLTERYRYDRAGNRTALERSDGTGETYTYGALNELLTVHCTSRRREAEGDSRPEDTDTIHFSYDTDGNLTGNGRCLYRYDGFGQMTEAVMEDGSTLVCRYDAEGLRHETEENGRLVRFIYSGRDAVCEEQEEGGSIRYIREHGRLAASDCEQARTYYHYACDSLGSVLYMLAGNEYASPENGGNLQERILCSYTYDAFGRTLSAAEQAENRYRFTGEQYDAITGQYYLRARYYRPETGRFTQMDTYHGDEGNLYVYAGNNPVRYVDPSGHEKSEKCENNGMEGTDGSESGRATDFYVTPNGEVVPATGYRYISENAPYIKDMTNSMTIPANVDGTYFSFNNYNIANPGALQVPHDASVKVSFDTLQIIDDISIPYGNWGKASYLEPITKDFPQFGSGGATQVITHSKIKIDSITKLPKK